MTRIVFGDADPASYTLPPAPAEIRVIYPVALRATLSYEVRLTRFVRSRCHSCGTRRVLYAITVNGDEVTGKLCARCAGVR